MTGGAERPVSRRPRQINPQRVAPRLPIAPIQPDGSPRRDRTAARKTGHAHASIGLIRPDPNRNILANRLSRIGQQELYAWTRPDYPHATASQVWYSECATGYSDD